MRDIYKKPIVWAVLLAFGIFTLPLRLFAGPDLTFSIPNYSVGVIEEIGTNSRVIGSGFLLDDVNYVVTAWHVVFDRATKQQRRLFFLPIRNLGTHERPPLLQMTPHLLLEERDIAVMKIEGKNLAKEPLVRGNTTSLRPGHPVGYGGFNASRTTFTLSADLITAILPSGDLRFLEIRGVAIPGFSGGPLFGGGETVVGIILRGDSRPGADGKVRFEAATVEQIPQFLLTGANPK